MRRCHFLIDGGTDLSGPQRAGLGEVVEEGGGGDVPRVGGDGGGAGDEALHIVAIGRMDYREVVLSVLCREGQHEVLAAAVSGRHLKTGGACAHGDVAPLTVEAFHLSAEQRTVGRRVAAPAGGYAQVNHLMEQGVVDLVAGLLIVFAHPDGECAEFGGEEGLAPSATGELAEHGA